MKKLAFYKDTLGCKNEKEVFGYFLGSLKPCNIIWSYFVDWNKVFERARKMDIALNTLNYLIGKSEFDKEFKFLLKQHPDVIPVLPTLAVRNGSGSNKYTVLVDYTKRKLVYETFDFSSSKSKDSDIKKYLEFVIKTGIRDLFTQQKIKNLVDYMIGVEAGLDSNGRKNRSGHSMEFIVGAFISDFCKKHGFKMLKEANAEKIKNEWGYVVPVNKTSRRYDFVINTGETAIIVETNFYGGSGSKIKSTASEYRNLYDALGDKYKFIWVTDGLGLKKTSKPLEETFGHNDYVVNLAMLEKGILDEIII